MERVQKDRSNHDHTNSRCVAQGEFAGNYAQGEIAARIDNSPLMVAQRRRLNSLFGETAQLSALVDARSGGIGVAPGLQVNPVQRALTPNVVTKSSTTYKVKAEGSPEDFESGTKATNYGIRNVDSYSASISTTETKNVLGRRTGKGRDVSIDPLNNKEFVPAKGHILAQSLGGSGELQNIFEQNAGQNNSGEWKSFENSAADLVNKSYKDSTITYKAELKGSGLDYEF